LSPAQILLSFAVATVSITNPASDLGYGDAVGEAEGLGVRVEIGAGTAGTGTGCCAMRWIATAVTIAEVNERNSNFFIARRS
jgi:hypothetical protein